MTDINTKYQACSKCIMDNNDDPYIEFDSSGICNHCHIYNNILRKRLVYLNKGVEEREKVISKIKKDGKGNDYDCIIGVSGGVDSTFVAILVKELGLRPLAVHLDNGWNSELATINIQNTLDKLGIDLYTHVINWKEFKDLQTSFLKASVIDIEVLTDHAILALFYNSAKKFNVKYILHGANVETEGNLPSSWVHYKGDLLNIRKIHEKFGSIPIKTFPTTHPLYSWYMHKFWGLQFIDILNYYSYNKEKTKKKIIKELNWRDYGGKHYESIFTRFYQSYILPKKFNVDKRKSHLSTLICSGQITRDEAQEEIKKPIYDPLKLSEDKTFTLKKFGLTENEFDQLMKLPIKQHTDYPSYLNIIKILRPFGRFLRKIGIRS